MVYIDTMFIQVVPHYLNTESYGSTIVCYTLFYGTLQVLFIVAAFIFGCHIAYLVPHEVALLTK